MTKDQKAQLLLDSGADAELIRKVTSMPYKHEESEILKALGVARFLTKKDDQGEPDTREHFSEQMGECLDAHKVTGKTSTAVELLEVKLMTNPIFRRLFLTMAWDEQLEKFKKHIMGDGMPPEIRSALEQRGVEPSDIHQIKIDGASLGDNPSEDDISKLIAKKIAEELKKRGGLGNKGDSDGDFLRNLLGPSDGDDDDSII